MGANKSSLKTRKLLEEISARTNYSVEQLRSWLKEIPSKGVTAFQFEAAYCTCFNKGYESGITDYIFRAFDTDKDGLIDMRDFFLSLYIISRGTEEERLELAFRLYDTNQDGEVSYQELLHILTVSRHLAKACMCLLF